MTATQQHCGDHKDVCNDLKAKVSFKTFSFIIVIVLGLLSSSFYYTYNGMDKLLTRIDQRDEKADKRDEKIAMYMKDLSTAINQVMITAAENRKLYESLKENQRWMQYQENTKNKD